MARLALHPQVSGAVDVSVDYRMEEIEVPGRLPRRRADARRRPGRGQHRRAPQGARPPPAPARRPTPGSSRATSSSRSGTPRRARPSRGPLPARRDRGARDTPRLPCASWVRDGRAPATRTLERPSGTGSATSRRTRRCCSPRSAGEPPRAIAEQMARPLGRDPRRAARAGRGRRPRVPQPRPGRLLVRGGARRHPGRGRRVRARRRATRSGSSSSSSRPTRPGPLTAASRPPRRLRRRAGADPRLPGHPVTREYYVNDHGTQVLQVRRVDPRAGAGRGGARGRLRGRLRGRAGAAPRRADGRSRSWRRPASRR